MNKCKDCKYFKRNTDADFCKKFGECNCKKFVYGTSTMIGNKLDFDEKLCDELLYMDYDYYDAFIEVGENFGCIHFEKEAEDE